MSGRFTVLGLASPRSSWFGEVGRWATAAAVPVEFVRCVSVEELRARLSARRGYSAAVVDGGLVGVDRDLLRLAEEAGCPVVVIDAVSTTRTWTELGACAVLEEGFSRDDLMGVLTSVAEPSAQPQTDVSSVDPPLEPKGVHVAVTGHAGAGVSTCTIALAQGVAGVSSRKSRSSTRRDVLLADMCLRADQAMLHDAEVLVPGLQDVVDAHRSGSPRPRDVVAQTFAVRERGYRLLLGLRNPSHWTGIRRASLEAGLRSLRSVADVVVTDVDADVEGEEECGSPDVADRNVLARTALADADVVVLVLDASMKGVHAGVRVMADLVEFGVEPARLVLVVNRSSRDPRRRRDVMGALTDLVRAYGHLEDLQRPTLLQRCDVESALRDGAAVPDRLARPLVTSVQTAIGRLRPRSRARSEPVPVLPGELGVAGGGPA